MASPKKTSAAPSALAVDEAVNLRALKNRLASRLARKEGGEREAPEADAAKLERVAKLFGGNRVLKRKLTSPLDAHEMLLAGLPGRALSTLVDNLAIDKSGAFEKAIGMSMRTVQRHREAPSRALSQEQSGRLWKFAEILAKATALLGSQEEVEKWLDRPAIGLNQRRPIDLLATPAGVELVEDFLERLEYGVYV